MQSQSWTGCFIPLITPFREDFSIDEAGLRRLVHYYIEEVGCDGLVPCGTTGESPTLDPREHARVIEIVVAETRRRVPVIAGTGSNSTRAAIEMTKQCEDAGADASLQVCPYYNRPTQDGLLRHFEAVAAATSLPIFVYNIPSRTGRLIEAATMAALSRIDNIVGMKDACGDLMVTMEIIRATRENPKKFHVLCGEDALTLPMMALGGDGGILAVAHVVGKEYREMIRKYLSGNVQEAREIHFRTLPVVQALFLETNPVPVKEALAMMDLPAGRVRLPLAPLRPENRERLRAVLKASGYLGNGIG
ncbi:MAG: 4-hydroxy-tetrahydrodipicolinate synthase [Syntrophaceae bacterium PtaU1.Bin231]|nr:MAG: 4-hydroxy-tetrahydrodipicolinate synthase [Syntrophaceae bacterium PtaU1.Bin231]